MTWIEIKVDAWRYAGGTRLTTPSFITGKGLPGRGLWKRCAMAPKTSLVEAYGLGKAKGLNRLFPSFLALAKRILGTSPVVQ